MRVPLERAVALAKELQQARARENLLDFMRYVWWNPQTFHVGRHTREICSRLTRAVEDFRRGKSTYLIVAVPFRHGKSDIVSRALPTWFLGRNADRQPDVIMTGYGADLIEKFSRKALTIIDSQPYREVFPGVEVGKHTARNWNIRGSVGEVTAVGLGGAITGTGGNLIIVDDYCKSRAEAVSATFRDRVWDAFRNDVYTRQNAPACIMLIVATPWHVDDLIGRIERETREDSGFPHFERLVFPARKEGEWEYLFPEHFSPEWYDSQRAVLGKQAAALLDCSPRFEGGERFDCSKVHYHDTLEGWPTGREVRGWDMASSTKERNGDDPDWTWGVRGLAKKIPIGAGLYRTEIWIRSMVCCRAEAPARNRLIMETIAADGPAVVQAIEAFGAYKDAYATMKELAKGFAVVKRSAMQGDKSAKAAPMEAPWEAGGVHVYVPGCRACLDRWKEDFSTFPGGAHDDAVDATAIMFHETTATGSMALI